MAEHGFVGGTESTSSTRGSTYCPCTRCFHSPQSSSTEVEKHESGGQYLPMATLPPLRRWPCRPCTGCSSPCPQTVVTAAVPDLAVAAVRVIDLDHVAVGVRRALCSRRGSSAGTSVPIRCDAAVAVANGHLAVANEFVGGHVSLGDVATNAAIAAADRGFAVAGSVVGWSVIRVDRRYRLAALVAHGL
jgi:hypothetical protein